MSKLGKEGHKRHCRKVFKSLNDKIVNSASSPSLNKRKKRENQIIGPEAIFLRDLL